MPQIYLDYNASAPLRREARAAMLAAMDICGNPSSIHGAGREAHRALEDARRRIAGHVGVRPQDVIFTSGGTEACNLAIHNAAQIIAGASEHPAVLEAARSKSLKLLPLDGDGLVCLDALEAALKDTEMSDIPPLVAIMGANNESGVMPPLADISRIVHEAGGVLFCDAVQMVGKAPFDMGALDIDMASLSAHKFGGPKGVGALVMRRGLGAGDFGQMLGGGQEMRRRAGTENLIGIIGMAAALDAACAEDHAEMRVFAAWRDAMEAAILRLYPQALIVGGGAPRLANVSLIAASGVEASTLVMALDLEGIAVSSGSACSSGKVSASHVLAAMGLGDLSAIRVSFGAQSARQDLEDFTRIWGKHVLRMQAAA